MLSSARRCYWMLCRASRRQQLTYERLSNLYQKDSLRQSLIRRILNDILEGTISVQELKILPSTVLDEILVQFLRLENVKNSYKGDTRTFGKRVHILHEILRIYQPKSIYLDGLMTFGTKKFKMQQLAMVIQMIANHAPDLECLTFSRTINEMPMKTSPKLSAVLSEKISKLRKLKKLTLSSYSMDLKDLNLILSQLTELQFVNVQLNFNNVSLEDIQTLNIDSPHLKVFTFIQNNKLLNENAIIFLNALTKACLERLPNLEIMQQLFTNVHKASFPVPKTFEMYTRTYKLRHLTISPMEGPLHLAFPNVTHLKIIWPMNRVYNSKGANALLKFSRVKSLTLENVPSGGILSKFLSTYGPQLETLNLGNGQIFNLNYELGKIFDVCPNLQNLSIIHSRLKITDNSRSIRFFAQLKSLFWGSTMRSRPAFLSKILKAPQLTHLTLCRENFDLKDLKRVSALIRERQILGKLQYFTFFSDTKEPEEHDPVLERHYDNFYAALFDFLKDASAFLPNLVGVDIRMTHQLRKKIFQRHNFGPYEYLFKNQHLEGKNALENAMKFRKCIFTGIDRIF
ncbi:Hypothetical predicted protein [Cloeon dipterum]|uniref:Uncharacterized protein n=1 Tax=Cloeon dipterum TaxID=197152 RepID=A0A8S1E1J2_9INSE|nr:Hypothetical predicted protein [Cloeon dipterum]